MRTGVLVLAALLLLAGGALTSWWSGHPAINGQVIESKTATIGLLKATGCDAKGVGGCKEWTHTSRTTSPGAAGFALAGIATTALAALAALALLVTVAQTGKSFWKKITALTAVGMALATVGAGAAFVALRPPAYALPMGKAPIFLAAGALLVAGIAISRLLRKPVAHSATAPAPDPRLDAMLAMMSSEDDPYQPAAPSPSVVEPPTVPPAVPPPVPAPVPAAPAALPSSLLAPAPKVSAVSGARPAKSTTLPPPLPPQRPSPERSGTFPEEHTEQATQIKPMMETGGAAEVTASATVVERIETLEPESVDSDTAVERIAPVLPSLSPPLPTISQPRSSLSPAVTTPSPACLQCDAPMDWVEEHARFFCRRCRLYY